VVEGRSAGPRVSVVVVTRDRCGELNATLGRLGGLPQPPRVIVVDNASRDGSVGMVRERFPDAGLVALPANLGAAGRSVGVRLARTPYVAFSDDDSWWEPGSLEAAVALLDAHPGVGLVAGRIQVEPGDRTDPVSRVMSRSPLGAVGGVGPRVLGFVACSAVVRREAYLGVGGFHWRFGVGGEEDLLALDLTRAGWDCCYAAHVVARHRPSTARDLTARRRRELRNALWTAWLRRRPRSAVRQTGHLLRRTGRADLTGAVDALRGLPWVLAERRPLDRRTAADLAKLDATSPVPAG
jgi:GT2 family glycosyltransferase